MEIRRRSLTALFLALLGALCLGGVPARADETVTACVHSPVDALRSASSRDIFSNELKKRQFTENHVAVCDSAVPSLPAAKSARSSRASRAGQSDFAQAAGGERIFPGLADLRQDFPPPADAAAPMPPALAFPSTRSPPLR